MFQRCLEDSLPLQIWMFSDFWALLIYHCLQMDTSASSGKEELFFTCNSSLCNIALWRPNRSSSSLTPCYIPCYFKHDCVGLGLVAQSCPTLDPIDCSPPGSSVHGDSPGKNTGVGCLAFLQGIFPTQGSNPGLPHCRPVHTVYPRYEDT